jgi:aspartate-semialdehyde dehydrogenase
VTVTPQVTNETRKIFNAPSLAISCTAVRIPTLRAHSEAITIETERPISADGARELLRGAAGVRVVDAPASNAYPMPRTATRSHDVEVGRIRQVTRRAGRQRAQASARARACVWASYLRCLSLQACE